MGSSPGPSISREDYNQISATSSGEKLGQSGERAGRGLVPRTSRACGAHTPRQLGERAERRWRRRGLSLAGGSAIATLWLAERLQDAAIYLVSVPI